MTEPQKEERGLGDMVFRLTGVVVIALAVVIAWLLMDFKTFRQNPLSIPDGGIALLVEPGRTLKSISAELKHQQVLEKPLYLRVLARPLDPVSYTHLTLPTTKALCRSRGGAGE